MKSYTYFDLKKKSKSFLWNFGIKNHFIDKYAEKMGYNYFDKITILEFLSVFFRQWDKKTVNVLGIAKSTV